MNKSFEAFREEKRRYEEANAEPEMNVEDNIPTHRPVIFTNTFNEDNKIFVNKELHEIGDEAWEILKNGDTTIYQKGGILVSPVYDEHNNVRLVEYNTEKMVGLLSDEITFVRLKISKGSILPEVLAIPHKAYASYIINNCDHSEIPPIDVCIKHPFVKRSKDDLPEFDEYTENVDTSKFYKYEIVNTGGIHYSGDIGIHLNEQSPKIKPFEDISKADFILQDVFKDFPYATDASLANSVGQLISSCMRFAIGTNMPPIALTTSQTHGSGKTMETDVIHAILHGTTANWSSRISSLDEYRKTLLTHALSGDPMVCFDNLNEQLNIEALASVATSKRLSGRILHTMSNVTLANYMQICINGTSLDVSTEIADRTIWKVMSTHEKTMDREFKYKSIIDDQVIPNRKHILSAIFTYIKKWIDNGSPLCEEKAKLHREKGWASIIGGILKDTMWYNAFLANTAQQRIQADTTYVRWTHTITELALHIGVKPGETETQRFTTAQAMPICSYCDYPLDEATLKKKVFDPDEPHTEEEPFFGHNMLGEDIGADNRNQRARGTTLGILFRAKAKNDGSPFGNWKIVDAGQHRQKRAFKLVWIGKEHIPEEFYYIDPDDDMISL